MGPNRKPRSARPAPYPEAGSSRDGEGSGGKRRMPRDARSADASAGAQGVSKLKASLRQTRRLLAKDPGPDVRVEAERRMKALEADLARAERANKERAMATRYHKVKFFDRKKVLRKLGQTKRRLAELEDDKTKEGKKERKRLKAQLEELRVDLNYIIHYPKTKKYISLHPPEKRSTSGVNDDGEAAPANAAETQSKTDGEREELRKSIRARMESGELSAEPELEVEVGANETPERAVHSKRPLLEHDGPNGSGELDIGFGGRAPSSMKKGRRRPEEVEAVHGDDFFDLE